MNEDIDSVLETKKTEGINKILRNARWDSDVG
jgi:hypothetical protein